MWNAEHNASRRPRLGWLWALWLLAAGCGGPARDGAQLTVTTSPPEALLWLGGEARDQSPTVLTGLPPGTQLLVARKPGYREARQAVALAPRQRLAVHLELEPLYGLALVHSTPPGAAVTMNGAHRGVTPLLMPDVPLGTHRLHFQLTGHLDREVELRVEQRVPLQVAVDLVPDAARLEVTSEPPGAEVLINGSVRGQAPCTLERVPSGEALLEVRQAGYRAFSQRLQLSVGETVAVHAALDPLPAGLTVRSAPAGAAVYVDNQHRGVTPLELPELAPGEYRLRVELRGYAPAARTVTLVAMGQAVEEFRLARSSGTLVLVTEPAGVRVFINGQPQGETRAAASGLASEPFEVDYLEAGEHNLQLTRRGYASVSKTIPIQTERVLNLHERLSRLFIPDLEVRIGVGEGRVFTGMLLREEENGDLILQISPTATMQIKAEDILSRKQLRAPLAEP